MAILAEGAVDGDEGDLGVVRQIEIRAAHIDLGDFRA